MESEKIRDLAKTFPHEVRLIIEFLLDQNTELKAQIRVLKARIVDLEAQINKNSSNSSKPPSSDGLKRKTRSRRKPNPAGKGGQKGHKGDTLKQTDKPDKQILLRSQICECGQDLTSIAGEIVERRQVFDVPQPVLEVTEYQTISTCCPACRKQNVGQFPDWINAQTQYGPNIRTYANYLSNFQFLPLERLSLALKDLFQAEVCEATLLNWQKEAATILLPFEHLLKQQILVSQVAHADETGFRVVKKTKWLHCFSTSVLSWFGIHEKRGRIAHKDHNLIPQFAGTLVTDGYRSYKYGNYKQALCHAHHLRELIGIMEDDPKNKDWAQKMIDWLLYAKSITDDHRDAPNWIPKSVQSALIKQFDELVNKGLSQNPIPEKISGQRGKPKQSKAKNLLDRFSEYRKACLRFIIDKNVPFDNNLAERDIRMMKVKSKISGCFRTDSGAEQFCLIRSFISTTRKQGKDVFTWLRTIWHGNPVDLLIDPG